MFNVVSLKLKRKRCVLSSNYDRYEDDNIIEAAVLTWDNCAWVGELSSEDCPTGVE